MNGVKVALGNKRNDGGGCTSMLERLGRVESLVHMLLNEFHVAIFA